MMRISTAYFAGIGTVVVAVAAGLGGGYLAANVVSPHEPTVSKLERRMSATADTRDDCTLGAGAVCCSNDGDSDTACCRAGTAPAANTEAAADVGRRATSRCACRREDQYRQ